jgi:hypothetical protein
MTTVPTAAVTLVPGRKSIVDILEGLLGRQATVTAGQPVIPRLEAPATVAVYTDRHITMRATIAMDLALSAYVGCALGLVPPSAAAEAIAAKDLPSSIQENLHEVLNVLTGSFNVDRAPHLSLYQVCAPGQPVPVDASVQLRTLGRRLDLWVRLHGYGAGGLSVVCSI